MQARRSFSFISTFFCRSIFFLSFSIIPNPRQRKHQTHHLPGVSVIHIPKKRQSEEIGMMKKEVIEILSSPEKEELGTALRPIFCLKSIKDMKQTEEVKYCFILEFDPFDSVDISKLSIKTEEDATDLSVIAEKGQVACRDYPHSRHLCLKFPFDTTPHENFCEQCYCYVCDCAAPCKYWPLPNKEHCHASESTGKWKLLRQIWKQNPVDC